jgi:uncharacterized SAM-binding protein YcdF (DUF218 family)
MWRFADLPNTLAMLLSGAWLALRGTLLRGVKIAGAMALVLALLAFTRIPFDAHRWLGRAAGECSMPPSLIVVLGGSGMPSGPELLRLHRAAEVAALWPDAAVVVVHPGDPAALEAMVDELVLRGVDRSRIGPVNQGDNTRAQALAVARSIPGQQLSMALVTAPENMYRSVLAFRKAGLKKVCGIPAWDHAMYHEFAYGHREIGGKGWMPDVSGAPGLRYTWWNYLKLEVTVLREWLAIAYYRLNAWI